MAAAKVIEIKGAVSSGSSSVPDILEGEAAAYVELSRVLARARVSEEALHEDSARARFDEVAALPLEARYGIKAAPFEAFSETFKQTVEVRFLAASVLSLCSTASRVFTICIGSAQLSDMQTSRYVHLSASACTPGREPGVL